MQKPTSVHVLGIINIVLASVGVLGACVAVGTVFLQDKFNPALAGVYTGNVLVVSLAIPLVGLVTKGLMLYSGIGLVKGEAYGRSIGILWAFASMVYGVTTTIINAAFLTPVIMEASFKAQPSPTPSPQAIETIQITTMIMGIVMGLAMSLGYQITFLVLMNRKAVKQYFAGGAESDERTEW